jgi:MFS family permease
MAENKSERQSLIDKRDLIEKEYEKAIEEVDMEGKFQKRAFYILATTAFLCSLILTGFPLQKEAPEYQCLNRFDFEDLEDYSVYKNNPRYKIIHSEECIDKFCNKMDNYQDAILWVIVADYNSVTNMVTALDVMCQIDNFSAYFTKMLFIGRIIATLLFAYISDNFGRRIAFSIGLVLMLVTNTAFFMLRNATMYYIIAFFANMCFQLYSLITVMSVEIMGSKLYSVLNGVTASLFAFCGVFNLLIMYFFKSWFVLLGIHIVIDALIIYLNFTCLTETPKFCLMKKDYTQLEDILIRIAKDNDTYVNKVSHKLEEISQIKKMIKKDSISSDNIKNKTIFAYMNPIRLLNSIFGPYIKILTAKNDLGNFLKFIIPYITVFFVYYGQLMFLEKIPGDPQFNSLLIFTSELFSPNLAGFLLTKTSRKLIITVFSLICIICCLIFPQTDNALFQSFLIFTNCFSICVILVVNYVFSAEAFDSSIKTSAISVLLLIANVAMIFGDILMNVFPSPFYMFALMCAATIFSVSSIKENYEIKSTVIAH